MPGVRPAGGESVRRVAYHRKSAAGRLWAWLRGGHWVVADAPWAYHVPAWWPGWRVDEALAVLELHARRNARRERPRVPRGVAAVPLHGGD